MSRFPRFTTAFALPLAIALLAAILLPALPAAAQGPMQSRTWTDSSGTYTVEASMLGIEGDKVTLLRADGRQVVVPLDKLSKADQDYIRAATFTATSTPANGQVAAPSKLPFDAAFVADDFQVAIIARPSQILKSDLAQSLMKLSTEPVSTVLAGIDLAQVDWVIAFSAAARDMGQQADAGDRDEAQERRMQVGIIVISQKPFDPAAIKASPQFESYGESMLNGKTLWSAEEGGISKELLFYSDNVLLASTDGMVHKMLAAKGSGKQMLNVLNQTDLTHDASMVVLASSFAAQFPAGGDGHPLDKVVKSTEHAALHLDLGGAPKLAVQMAAVDAQQARKIKESADAGIGMVKLIATLTLQEQLQDLQVDTTPLSSLISDTLNSFQSSVDGNKVSMSLAAPTDTVQRVEQCAPIVKAILAKQSQGGNGAAPLAPTPQP
jgi:hypothetical protein